ncbi:hypothetical protein [Caulobacter sp. 17J65-9]|uniref:hypothetical protein n=1 Tax=Caulobacter sp. 17J65-9 TaxID=2709382 RepID=UPI0013C67887|nr:hypothetical protein [Caulobacter sp. 17J65-9]NEX94849.1 hypothetical protein [Caulobacter sp. 17J65-9]
MIEPTQPPAGLAAWDRCAPWLAAALEHSLAGWTVEDLRAGVARGQAQFWPGEGAALVTEIASYPNRRVLEAVAAGGDGAEIADVLRPQAEAWARANGCAAVMVAGRPGWARRLKEQGYGLKYLVLGKDL